MNKNFGIIYKITNTFNDKLYIGQTTRSLKKRINEYKYSVINNKLNNVYLLNSIKKHGWDSFKFEIIDTANNINELNEKEIFYINKFKTTNKKYGYNIKNGGRNALNTIEIKNKISKSNKGKKQNNDWINKRISKSGTDDAKKYGKKKSLLDKKHLSNVSPKYWKNKKRSIETINKIKETKNKNGVNKEYIEKISKKVYVYDINLNILINTFDSTKIAAYYYNVNQSTISRYCKNDKIINNCLFTYINKEKPLFL